MVNCPLLLNHPSTKKIDYYKKVLHLKNIYIESSLDAFVETFRHICGSNEMNILQITFQTVDFLQKHHFDAIRRFTVTLLPSWSNRIKFVKKYDGRTSLFCQIEETCPVPTKSTNIFSSWVNFCLSYFKIVRQLNNLNHIV